MTVNPKEFRARSIKLWQFALWMIIPCAIVVALGMVMI